MVQETQETGVAEKVQVFDINAIDGIRERILRILSELQSVEIGPDLVITSEPQGPLDSATHAHILRMNQDRMGQLGCVVRQLTVDGGFEIVRIAGELEEFKAKYPA